MNHIYDICVFNMRARPFGPQHLYNIREALSHAPYVFVMVGSAGEPINFRNPFTAEEVMMMVRGSLTPIENDRVYLFAVPDQGSDMAWVTEVQRLVREEAARLSISTPRISLIGHAKDASSYYLRLFPQWGAINTDDWRDGYSSTGIRESIYKTPTTEHIKDMKLPLGSEVFLRQWIASPAFERMQAEYLHNIDEAAKFPPHPYHGEGVAFHPTADVCMFQAGGVILVKRGAMPGLGLWALPGGHVNPLERFRKTAVREFTEETNILELNDITVDDINLALRSELLLDDPWRSTRMRTISMAYGGILPGTTRVRVEGADDAAEARVWNLDEVTRDMMFEDHYLVIQHFANQFNIR